MQQMLVIACLYDYLGYTYIYAASIALVVGFPRLCSGRRQ